MNRLIQTAALTLTAAALAGSAQAQVVVNSNITTSTTWTANNVYDLSGQIFVEPGATLTIEAGTVVASTSTVNGSGSLCVTRGAQIFVQGTKDNPVTMTSNLDRATWTAGDPATGTWREAANEWGNLTICGDAYISENAIGGNTPAPSATNVANMEGLTIPVGQPASFIQYGGGNDDDDSGSISYLSLRYGGRVIGLGNELNGLSLGGLGRGTDIGYVEIMNNVDDGIEIWGGTLNIDHFAIWNIGDDSFDVDQGWRGKAQFGLIVQGYSVDASQGSGVGDNCFETDGAELCDYQPVTTAAIYNCTVIGQPVDGDGATAWRDGARVQYRNCVFMDCGERLVRFDNDEDGGGYGCDDPMNPTVALPCCDGTLEWTEVWTTPYTFTEPNNAFANPALAYQAQVDGNLAEIKDSVFFRNLNGSAYDEAIARDVFNPVNNNVRIDEMVTVNDADAPIRSITRAMPVTRGGKVMLQVVGLDPRANNAALYSVDSAPSDGFFEVANYRGAFDPSTNWLCGWTASEAFGFTAAEEGVFEDFCNGDGGDQMGCTDCFCGNNAPVGTIGGCLNSRGTSARLLASGEASAANDTLRFELVGGTTNTFVNLVSGGAQAPAGMANPCFGLNSGIAQGSLDGLRCAVQGILRHGTRPMDSDGNTGFTNNGWGFGSGPPGGIISFFGFTAGQTRHFQAFYRENSALGCGSGVATSQGITVDILP